MRAFLQNRSNFFWYFAPLLAIPLFLNLGKHPVFLWDESRQAMNMLEMHSNGNYLVTHFEGLPEHYNTKPPLLIWLQLFFYKIGFNLEWAMRLPSAIAGMLTAFILFKFTLSNSNNVWVALFSSFILVSISGYVELHGTRTGDYDALVTLFTTLSLVAFYQFCQTEKSKKLFLFYLFFGLGIGCKAAVPLMFLPLLLIWLLYTNKLLKILLNKHFYIGMLIPIFIVILLYGGRELVDPGYLKASWKMDFGGRFGGTVDGHDQPFYYYWQNLWLERAFIFLPAFLLMLIMAPIILKKKYYKVILYCGLIALGFVLILSFAQTKIYWYDTPIFPFLSLGVAFAGYYLSKHFPNKTSKLLVWIPLLLITANGFINNTIKSWKASHNSWESAEVYSPAKLFKIALSGRANYEGYSLLCDTDYLPHFEVYNKLLKDKKGYKIEYKRYLYEIDKNKPFFHYQNHVFGDSLFNQYKAEQIDSINHYLKVYELLRTK